MNGGTSNCKDLTCVCPKDFIGTFCEKLSCSGFTCLNSGTCNLTGICQCQPAYSGSKCEICNYITLFLILLNILQFYQVIGCLAGGPYTCQNGGNCTNTNGIGYCRCSNGYSGSYCTTSIGCVAGSQYTCLNGGSCNTNTGECQCAFGFGGSTCFLCNKY
jgi:Notch-like protein